MSDLTNLQTARSQIIERIVEVTANPKPSYLIDGQKVNWNEYLESLTTSLASLDSILANEEGPFEYESRGTS